jgi:RNA polymerase sigma factor for flagellar operon FliA
LPPSEPHAPGGSVRPRRARADEERLLRAALPLLDSVALGLWRRWGRRYELEELEAVGRVALVPLLRDYDPERAPLEPYLAQRLSWAIRDEVRRDTHCRSQTVKAVWAAAGPRGRAERSGESDDAVAQGSSRSGSEHAEELGRSALDPEALPAGAAALATGTAHDPEQSVCRKRDAERLWRAVAALPRRERALVEAHYGREQRFDRVAGRLGISKSWASRLHARALARLGTALDADGGCARSRPGARAQGRGPLPAGAGAPSGSLR